MIIVRPTSLADTLDATEESYFYQKPLPTNVREEVASLIISRQVHTGENVGFFIPFAAETETKAKLFSGEQLNTTFAQTHVHLIEATRILKSLALKSQVVTQSILLADRRMDRMCYSKFCAKGECRALTIACLRYLLLDDTGNSASVIHCHLTNLTNYRDRKGKWGNFPFYYTLLMLSEVDDPLAKQELQHAAPNCEKLQAKNWPADPVSKRRQDIIANALARS
jgi:hypothetical protein